MSTSGLEKGLAIQERKKIQDGQFISAEHEEVRKAGSSHTQQILENLHEGTPPQKEQLCELRHAEVFAFKDE